MKWSWPLDTWRILINLIRSWSPWSRRILNLLIFRNKFSLNMNWILFIPLLKRKLAIAWKRNCFILICFFYFKPSFSPTQLDFLGPSSPLEKIRKNPNNLYLDLLFKPLTKQLEILNYYLNSFFDCNHIMKLLTLPPFPGLLTDSSPCLKPSRPLLECNISLVVLQNLDLLQFFLKFYLEVSSLQAFHWNFLT